MSMGEIRYPNKNSSNVGLIAGTCVGALVLLVMAISTAVVMYRRKQTKEISWFDQKLRDKVAREDTGFGNTYVEAGKAELSKMTKKKSHKDKRNQLPMTSFNQAEFPKLQNKQDEEEPIKIFTHAHRKPKQEEGPSTSTELNVNQEGHGHKDSFKKKKMHEMVFGESYNRKKRNIFFREF